MEQKQSKSGTAKETLEKILLYARHGIGESEIQELLGITKAAFREKLRKNPDLMYKIKNAGKLADIEVEEALFRRATGYQTVEEIEVYIPISENERAFKFKERRCVKKLVPPDATSAQIWLYNRKSAQWSKNPAVMNDLSNNDITALKKLAAEEAAENM